jgi:hypothetical protein
MVIKLIDRADIATIYIHRLSNMIDLDNSNSFSVNLNGVLQSRRCTVDGSPDQIPSDPTESLPLRR